jgi:hypothetical protein
MITKKGSPALEAGRRHIHKALKMLNSGFGDGGRSIFRHFARPSSSAFAEA